MHYYKFNIADWNLGTAHLSLVEEAIYFRLINHYYDSELPIPLETQSVFRRLRMASESVIAQQIIDEFFIKTDKGYIHERCDVLLKEYRKTAKNNRSNGAKGGRPRKDAACDETQPKPSGFPPETQQEPEHNPNQEPLTTNQEPETSILKPSAQAPSDTLENPDPVEPVKPAKAKPDYPEWFKSIMAAYPKRAGGNSTSQAYVKAQARIKEGASHDQLLWAVERYGRFIAVTGKTGTEFVKQASTFFGSMENIENQWAPPALGANHAGQPKSPIERFMRKHYPNASAGPQDDRGPMGSNDGVIRGAVDPQLWGDAGRIGPMDQDIVGSFSRSDS